MRVDITGIGAAQALLRAIAAADVQPALEAIATAEADHLASVTPVRTGEARGGWHVDPLPNGAVLSNAVEHVPFLIEGTGRRRIPVVNRNWAGMSPNAALRDAWLTAPERLAAEAESAVHELLP